jgi:UDP:flavonoid glycosyltransferase YjiC (YdhE family)
MNGKPSVVIPFEGDQNENGMRLSYLRAGHRLRYRNLTARALREAILKVLEDPAFSARSEEIARLLARQNGPQTASDLIERLLKTGRPVLRAEIR